MRQPEHWAPDIITEATKESKAEANKELFAGTVDVRIELDGILERFGLRKAMRVCVDLAVYAQLSPSAEPTNQWTAEH